MSGRLRNLLSMCSILKYKKKGHASVSIEADEAEGTTLTIIPRTQDWEFEIKSVEKNLFQGYFAELKTALPTWNQGVQQQNATYLLLPYS